MKPKIKNFKIILDDEANLEKSFENTNPAIKKILFFNSAPNKYKILFYSESQIQTIIGKKYYGTIEKNGLHWSRLYTSKIKQKSYIESFVGSDITGNKDTLFFNFDLRAGTLKIKRKVKFVQL